MRYEEAIAKHAPLSAYERGYVQALWDFSVNRNGEKLIGSPEKLVGDAVDRFLSARPRPQAREPWNEATGEGVDLS